MRQFTNSLLPLLNVPSPDQIRWGDLRAKLSSISVDDLGSFSLHREDNATGVSSDSNTYRNLADLCAREYQATMSSSPSKTSSGGQMSLAKKVVPHKAACATLLTTPVAEVSLFVLPPGAKLPLHDHPTQHVMSRVLHGQLQDVSVDWCQRHSFNDPHLSAARSSLESELQSLHATVLDDIVATAQMPGISKAARQQALSRMTPPLHQLWQERSAGRQWPSFLTSAYDGVIVRSTTHVADQASRAPPILEFSATTGGGVLHEFSAPAHSPAVFLDIIAPPYFTPPWNIDCHYYKCRVVMGAGAKYAQAGDPVVLGHDWTCEMEFDELVPTS